MRYGDIGVEDRRIRARFLSVQNVCGANPVLYSRVRGGELFSRCGVPGGMQLSTDLYVSSTLKMCESVPLLPNTL
jgi:hypothetical protein